MKSSAFALAVLGTVIAGPAIAKECIVPLEGANFEARAVAAYATNISEMDLTGDEGARLTEVSAVLRRERENYHFGPGPSLGEEPDDLFADPANLNLFVKAGLVFYCDWSDADTDALANEIVSGTLEARVHVTVYVRPGGQVLLHIESWG